MKEARHQLTLARKKLRNAMKEVAALMAFIEKKGGDASGRPALSNRNLRIYKLRQKGASAREIALQFKLSMDRVRAICAAVGNKRKRRAR